MSTVRVGLAVPITRCARAADSACLAAVSRVQGEHLLHVLNTLGSRKVVLEAELREIDDDIAQNASMARKYGDDFFTEGSARLAQSRVRASRTMPRTIGASTVSQRSFPTALTLTAGKEAGKAGRD